MTAKKELIARVLAGDVKACVELIEQAKPGSFDVLLRTCFADMNPSAEQFDVVADGWDLVKEMERLREQA